MRDTDELEFSWWKEGSFDKFCELRHNDPDRELLHYPDALMPYVKYVLPRLKELGLSVAIASSSTKHAIDRMMDECGIRGYFDLRVSGEDFERSKPDPAVYLAAIERLGIPAHKVVAVEDSTVGVQAARAAGTTVVARADARFDFDQSPADYIVGDLLEAYDVISRLV